MVPAFARQGFQVCRETLDPRGQQALRAFPVFKDPQDHVETKAKPGSEGPPGPKGPPGTLGAKGAKGKAGDKGPQGILGSNWKQCVWENIDDGKDTGLIKVNIEEKLTVSL